MAQGNRTAIHIDARRIEIELANIFQHHGGKGFVDLKQVDVPETARPQRFSSLRVTGPGAVNMIVGSLPMVEKATTRARGRSPASIAQIPRCRPAPPKRHRRCHSSCHRCARG